MPTGDRSRRCHGIKTTDLGGRLSGYPRSCKSRCRCKHDLRHYVATRLLAAGVDVRSVAGRLGHRNAATTLNVYYHFLAEADREAANVLGRIFDDAITAGSE
ncbi:MAG: tyrosine-type recombinase/integrase [Acidimicrobiales bacterium]